MSAITSANVAQAILDRIADEVQPALQGSFVMGNLVRRDFDAELKDAGDTVNVPISPGMTANDLSEGGSVQTQNPSPGSAEIVLDRHKEASFQIPDVTKAIAFPDLLKLYMEPAVVAIAEQIETDLLSQYTALTMTSAVGTSNTDLTETVVDDAETALFAAKVPVSAQKYMVVSGSAYSALRQISRFSEESTVGTPQAIISGNVGRIKDFMVFRSQYVNTVSTTTYNLAFVRNALALVMRRLPLPAPGMGAVARYLEFGNFGFRLIMSYEKNTLATQVTIDSFYGVGGIEKRHGLQVLS